MKTANDYKGRTDSDVLEQAIVNRESGIAVIPPRALESEPERDFWLIDRAILLPENTTVILQNCKIKLSDKCRDNFFRTANCGIGIEDPKPIRNIHIRGEGTVVLEGSDHPRATGDGSKILSCPCPKNDEDLIRYADWVEEDRKSSGKLNFEDIHGHSYGTDALIPGESHYGDWRGIGILFANAENISVENLKIVHSHGWGISLEACAHGRIENIDFDADMSRAIDGMTQNSENQDGIDLRNGCHDLLLNHITGGTGDDLIALTAICDKNYKPGGSMKTTHVMHNDWCRRERDIYNITIRNVMGFCQSNICNILRFLSAESEIYNIVVDGVTDISPTMQNHGCVILFGEPDGAYGRNLPGSLHHISVSNVIAQSHGCFEIPGYLQDSVFSNILNKNPECPVFHVTRENGLKNISYSNVLNASDSIILQEI